jgi:hypothetical protein
MTYFSGQSVTQIENKFTEYGIATQTMLTRLSALYGQVREEAE